MARKLFQLCLNYDVDFCIDLTQGSNVESEDGLREAGAGHLISFALPILLPSPPPSRPFFNEQPENNQPTLPASSPPLTPLLQNLLATQNPTPSKILTPNFPNILSLPSRRPYRRIGKSRYPNKGKPWSNCRLSQQSEKFLQTLIDPQFNVHPLDEILSEFLASNVKLEEFDFEEKSWDVMDVIKGLGFYKKCDLALKVFERERSHDKAKLLVNNSVVAVIINILGKKGVVSVAGSLLNDLQKDRFCIDVCAYTSFITAYASNGRYRESVWVFIKIEEEDCKPTLITYNVILNVYGKMGGSLYDEAAEDFEEMKLAGFRPDKVSGITQDFDFRIFAKLKFLFKYKSSSAKIVSEYKFLDNFV
ncbi:Pentatricopeptide repeat [Dillenia turbinata]|uniref:Pentatricopeptide repeat n=1 Tax=Dillenia turbinata TaxID=194707 RepID=A0AAN8UUY7_9MAGN